MKEIFTNFATASLSGSVLILAVILARFALCKAPKRYACLLWLLVGLRLLVPFTVESRLSLQPDPVTIPQLHSEIRDPQLPSQTPSLPVQTNPPATAPDVIPGGTDTEDVPQISIPDSTPLPAQTPDYIAIAAWVWSLGAGGILCYALISYWVLKYKLRQAIQLEKGVYEDASVHSPFLLGYWKPKIYLPCHVAAEYSSFILAHERCHIRRGDNWVKLIGFVCLALHWYNPLAWLAYSLLCRDVEMACDEAVIRTMDTPQRKAYSAALLSCAAKRQAFSACPVAFGEVRVKQRILKVLHYKKPAFWLTIVAVIALCAIAVCFLTSPAADSKATEITPVEKCRQAIVKLQNAEYYYLEHSLTLADFKEGSNDPYDFYYRVRSGEDWYYEFSANNWCQEYLICNGRQFARTTNLSLLPEDVPYPEWTEADLSGEELLQSPLWLFSFDWEANPITLKDASEDGSVIKLAVEWSDPSIANDILHFYFCDDNTLIVSRMIQTTSGIYTDRYTIKYDDPDVIADKMAQQLDSILAGTDEPPSLSDTTFAAFLTQPSEADYAAYKVFFYNRFGRRERVIFADVTQDGRAEMLVLRKYTNGSCSGYVYTLDVSGNVTLLYSNSGGADHVSGFYGWYLKPTDNGFHLAEETFGMNNGIGTLAFEEYYLRPDGKRVSVERIYVSAEGEDPEPVSEEALAHYKQQLNERIAYFFLIYNTATESNGKYQILVDSFWQEFD